MKAVILFALTFPCITFAKAPSKPVPVPDDLRVVKDVTYLPGGRNEKADLYFPKVMPADAKLPVVIVIHGGYVAMSINYWLWNNGVKNPTWPQSFYDAPHSFDLQPSQRDLRPVVLGFLNKHLKAAP